MTERPFRAPHHTVSPAGLTGGGSSPKPGELSLAHNGVLFLDELPEFQKTALEALRQPLEDRRITISRAKTSRTYPCGITLIAAMNPCPCGYRGHPSRRCTCTPQAAARYLSRVSGPLLDRIDLHVDVLPVDYAALRETRRSESSAELRERVTAARVIQQKRFEGLDYTVNACMPHRDIVTFCALSEEAARLLQAAFERLSLTARSYDRVLRSARTIADLAGESAIAPVHIAEALQYRSLDRKYWTRGM